MLVWVLKLQILECMDNLEHNYKLLLVLLTLLLQPTFKLFLIVTYRKDLK